MANAKIKDVFQGIGKFFQNAVVKKTVNILRISFTWLVVAVAVFMMVFTLISVTTMDKQDRNILGFKFFAITSDSMKKTDFQVGDIIISRRIDVNKINPGDIITFVSDNPESEGKIITHKVREVVVVDGVREFVTYGTSTNQNDDARATVVLGKYVGKLPGFADFFLYLKTTPGYILCILVPFLLLILSQGINCIHLFRTYKKEQTAILEEERKKIEQEREESRRMMAELLALKAQLAAKESPSSTEDPPETQ